MSSPRLLSLPSELLEQIFIFIHPRDLYDVSLAHSILHRTIQSSVALCYSVQCHISGKQNNPFSPHSLSQRLDALNRREEAWLHLKPTFKQVVSCPPHCGALYDLSCGTLILGNLDKQSLVYLDLATLPNKDVLWKSIEVEAGSFILDFAVSLEEQDLLAWVTATPEINFGYYHLRLDLMTFSGQKKHPLAQSPQITLPHTPGILAPDASIKIYGALIAIVLSYMGRESDIIHIFDWKTGDLKLRWLSSDSPDWTGIAFLSEDIVCLSSLSSKTLNLIRLQSTSEVASLSPNLVEFQCMLHLPPLAEGWDVQFIGCRMEPTFPSTRSFHDKPNKAFFNTPETSVMLLFIQLVDLADDTVTRLVSLIVPRDTLLKRFLEEEDKALGLPSVVLDWTDWGPDATYLWSSQNSENWITATCGQRYATLVDERLHIMDFNPNVVRMRGSGRLDCPLGEEEENALTQQRLLPTNRNIEDQCFAEAVKSNLPMVVYRGEEPVKWSAVLLDEEYVLGITVENSNGEIRELEIQHFG